MKKLVSLLLCLVLIQLPVSAASIELASNRILEWDAVTQYDDGTPVDLAGYTVGLFLHNSNVPVLTANSGITSIPVLAFYLVMDRPPAEYDFRVAAIATDGEASPWSIPLVVYRAKKNLPPPNNPHLKP